MRFPKKLKEHENQRPNEENNDENGCGEEQVSESSGIPKLVQLNHSQSLLQLNSAISGFPVHNDSLMQEENLSQSKPKPSGQSLQTGQMFSSFDRGDYDGDFVPDTFWDDANLQNCETWSNPDRFSGYFQEEELPITHDERAESMLVEALTESEHKQAPLPNLGGLASRNDSDWATSVFLQKQPPPHSKKDGRHFGHYHSQTQFLDIHGLELDQELDCNHLAHARTRMEGFGMAEEAMNSGKYELSEQHGILGTAAPTTANEKSQMGKKINRHPISQFEAEPNRKQSKTTSDEIFSQTDEYTTSVPSHLLAPRPVCNCKNSKCLKLYCACFRKGIACCVECKCADCQNNNRGLSSNSLKRKQRNAIHRAEAEESCCNCRMSFCEKSYCVCARNGKGCGPNCKCFNCKNPQGAKGPQPNARG